MARRPRDAAHRPSCLKQKMSKKIEYAKVVSKAGKLTPNGRERVDELRRGKKGAGAVITSVRVWPWSQKSEEKADEILFAAAERAGVIVESAEY